MCYPSNFLNIPGIKSSICDFSSLSKILVKKFGFLTFEKNEYDRIAGNW